MFFDFFETYHIPIEMALFTLLFLGASLLIGYYTAVSLDRNRKTALILFGILTIAFSILMFSFFGWTAKAFEGLLYGQILLYASYSDVCTRKCPDFVHFMILSISFITLTPDKLPERLTAVLFLFALFFVVDFFYALDLGGADLKISLASFFLLGLQPGIIGFLLGLVLAILVNLYRKKGHKEHFALIPYLSIGFLSAYLLQGGIL